MKREWTERKYNIIEEKENLQENFEDQNRVNV
jgi:hypothetical protein